MGGRVGKATGGGRQSVCQRIFRRVKSAAMLTWKDVTEDKLLAELPYKIELTGAGKILMSPPQSRHSMLQGQVAYWLNRVMEGGMAMPECPVDTSDNTKVVDVAWASNARIDLYYETVCWPEAPEICIEVVSPSNTFKELKGKVALYFERGAVECWICNQKGEMTFYTRDGERTRSAVCPEFPLSVR